MSHLSSWAPLGLFVLGLGAFAPGCSDDAKPDSGIADAMGEDAAPALDATSADVLVVEHDVGVVLFHDAGGPEACTYTCDCPQGLACIGGECRSTGSPVYCCANLGCPLGQACLGEMDRPSTCPLPPDAGTQAACGVHLDAGLPVGADAGAGTLGAACEGDFDCNTGSGLTCWAEFDYPFYWGGLCTIDNCGTGCSAGSACIGFPNPPPGAPEAGCFATCIVDADCRSDAYCRLLGNGVEVCWSRCRDDAYDCDDSVAGGTPGARTGLARCDYASGDCVANTCHLGALAGDECYDTGDCAEGYVCLQEFLWFAGGMCTKICSGLPDSAPCGAGETCQSFAGVGMCFKDCVNNACPDRTGAVCGILETTWTLPSCIPQ